MYNNQNQRQVFNRCQTRQPQNPNQILLFLPPTNLLIPLSEKWGLCSHVQINKYFLTNQEALCTSTIMSIVIIVWINKFQLKYLWFSLLLLFVFTLTGRFLWLFAGFWFVIIAGWVWLADVLLADSLGRRYRRWCFPLFWFGLWLILFDAVK